MTLQLGRTQRKGSGRLAATAAVIALFGGSVVGMSGSPTAEAASPAVAEPTHLSETEVSALLSAGAQPNVQAADDSEVEFVDAVVGDDYLEVGAVPESVGDAHQEEAVKAAFSPAAPVGDIADVARIDLEADTAVIGVTWDRGVADPEGVYWRYLSYGVWEEWRLVDIDENEAGPESRAGTEPIAVSNAQAVEVLARTADGRDVPGLALHVVSAERFGESENALLDIYPDPDELEAEIEGVSPDSSTESEDSVLTDADNDEARPAEPFESDEEQQVETETDVQDDVLLDLEGSTPAENAVLRSDLPVEIILAATATLPTALNAAGTVYDTGYSGLKIGTRKGWGAPTTSTWKPEAITIQGAVVHHTEGNNNYTQAQVPQQIRNVYHYQAVTRGWGDIGYNLVVDKYGGVWEGRYGGLTNAVKGAQAYGANSETFGITIMGNYLNSAPPTVARQAMSKAIAWKLHTHGIKSSTATIQVPGQKNLNAGNGKKISVPTVSAHRDVGSTDCPGNPLYAQMNTVRSEVQAHLDALGKTTSSGSSSSTGSTTSPTTTFSAGNVVSDAVFFNSGAMTEAEIKTFIETQGSSCKPGPGTTCLKDTKFSTQNLTTLRGGCKPLNMSGDQSPWTIIKKTAEACDLNPQVILVTLQKEQSGLTQPKSAEVWAKAMGSGCPDGSGCDPAQGGFQKQVYYGADKLVSYQLRSQAGHVDAFKAGKPLTINQNPAASCGTESVKFSNVATASLYEYTPYIGNSSKTGCATLGQKMFWDLMKRYFSGGSSSSVGSEGSSTPPSSSSSVVVWGAASELSRGFAARTVFTGDWDRNGSADAMQIANSGVLRFHRGSGSSVSSSGVRIGHGWAGHTWVGGGVDWNGDGKVDLLSRHHSGRLYLYPGDGKGGFGTPRMLGRGWGGFSQLTVGKMGTGIGVYAVKNGTLYAYPGDGRGGFKPSFTVSSGWNHNMLVAAGDLTGNGQGDVLTRSSNGVLYLHAGTSGGRLAAPVQVGSGWGSFTAIGSSGPTSTKSALWGVTSDGRLLSHPVR